MDIYKLKSTFDELLERLDQYYHFKLLGEPRTKANLENYKDDLLQELFAHIWETHSKSVYNNYLPETFIWLKAEQLWIKFTRQLKQQPNENHLNNLPEYLFADNDYDEFESRDLIHVIEEVLSKEACELLRYRMQGFTYKEIKQLAKYPSANAAKTKFNRIKDIIRTHFNRI